MRVLIERLFGSLLTFDRAMLDGLLAGLDRNLVVESDWLDYKGKVRGSGAANLRRWKESISEAVVAFSNSMAGTGGLVVVGVRESDRMPVAVTPIPRSDQSYEQLRDWLQSDIQCVPARFRELDLEVVEVNAGAEGSVFLIEVHPKERAAVYYSVARNQAYQRRTDASLPIPLAEVLEIVRARVQARVSMVAIPTPSPSPLGTEELRLQWRNEGITPGRDLTAKMVLEAANGLEAVTFEGTRTAEIPLRSSTRFELAVSAGMPPATRPLYPGTTIDIGILRWPRSIPSPISLTVMVWESAGASRQRLVFSRDLHGAISTSETVREFRAHS